jgi:hypothetical protein
MNAQTVHRGGAAFGALAVLFALAGCSLLNPEQPANPVTTGDADTVKFVACLTAQGQTAKIVEGGMVGMLLSDDAAPEGTGGATLEGEEGGPTGTTSVTSDNEGEWQSSTTAEGYPEDNGMREAWTTCEAEVPDFEQPEPDISGDDTSTDAEQAEALLAFAECARDAGYADFPDPADDGSMNLPAGITEDGFRQLLEECFDPEKPMAVFVDEQTSDSLDFDLGAVMREFVESHPEFGPIDGSGGSQ